jgi:hypothetical protein
LVVLNRATAVAMRDGPEAGLAIGAYGTSPEARVVAWLSLAVGLRISCAGKRRIVPFRRSHPRSRFLAFFLAGILGGGASIRLTGPATAQGRA